MTRGSAARSKMWRTRSTTCGSAAGPEARRQGERMAARLAADLDAPALPADLDGSTIGVPGHHSTPGIARADRNVSSGLPGEAAADMAGAHVRAGAVEPSRRNRRVYGVRLTRDADRRVSARVRRRRTARTRVRASPAARVRSLTQADLAGSPIVRLLLGLRMLPSWSSLPRPASGQPRAGLDEPSPCAISRRAGSRYSRRTRLRELLIGVVGTFWTLRGERRAVDAATFHGPQPAGSARAAWNFRSSPETAPTAAGSRRRHESSARTPIAGGGSAGTGVSSGRAAASSGLPMLRAIRRTRRRGSD